MRLSPVRASSWARCACSTGATAWSAGGGAIGRGMEGGREGGRGGGGGREGGGGGGGGGGRGGRGSAGGEGQLEALVRLLVPERPVEAVRVGALLVGGQLREGAAPLPAPRVGPGHHV